MGDGAKSEHPPCASLHLASLAALVARDPLGQRRRLFAILDEEEPLLTSLSQVTQFTKSSCPSLHDDELVPENH